MNTWTSNQILQLFLDAQQSIPGFASISWSYYLFACHHVNCEEMLCHTRVAVSCSFTFNRTIVSLRPAAA